MPILEHDSDSTSMTLTQVMGTQLKLFFGDSDLRLDLESRFSDLTTTSLWSIHHTHDTKGVGH